LRGAGRAVSGCVAILRAWDEGGAAAAAAVGCGENGVSPPLQPRFWHVMAQNDGKGCG